MESFLLNLSRKLLTREDAASTAAAAAIVSSFCGEISLGLLDAEVAIAKAVAVVEVLLLKKKIIR